VIRADLARRTVNALINTSCTFDLDEGTSWAFNGDTFLTIIVRWACVTANLLSITTRTDVAILAFIAVREISGV
jgi:hypothetical protein